MSETGHLNLMDAMGNPVAYGVTSAVQDLFLLYKKVHLETYNNHLTEAGLDSMLTKATPAFTLRAQSENTLETDSIQLYWKSPAVVEYDDMGEPLPWDGSRMYGRVNGDEIVLVQRFVIDPLLKPLPALLR